MVELQDPKGIKITFMISGLQVPKKGLFAKKPPAWWPSTNSNADVSKINIYEANAKYLSNYSLICCCFSFL